MKKLYLLAGAYDEGTETIFPFYADYGIEGENKLTEHILYQLDTPNKYESVLRSLGSPKTIDEFWTALSNSFVDGDSKMGWVLRCYDLSDIVDLT